MKESTDSDTRSVIKSVQNLFAREENKFVPLAVFKEKTFKRHHAFCFHPNQIKLGFGLCMVGCFYMVDDDPCFSMKQNDRDWITIGNRRMP